MSEKKENKTWDTILHNVGDVADFVNDITSTISPFTTIFGTNVHAPFILVSQISKKLGELNDDVLEQNVFGLSATVLKLDKMIERSKNGHPSSPEELELLRDNIKAIGDVIRKTSKMVS